MIDLYFTSKVIEAGMDPDKTFRQLIREELQTRNKQKLAVLASILTQACNRFGVELPVNEDTLLMWKILRNEA